MGAASWKQETYVTLKCVKDSHMKAFEDIFHAASRRSEEATVLGL